VVSVIFSSSPGLIIAKLHFLFLKKFPCILTLHATMADLMDPLQVKLFDKLLKQMSKFTNRK